MQRLRSPLAMRVPLFDPDRLLDLTLPLVRPLFTVFGFLAWLALVLTGVMLAILHWPELTSDVADRVLATENVALDHVRLPGGQEPPRAGHAYATKVWGGEVHEVGVMLLVFIPVLYVDASASAAFPRNIAASSSGRRASLWRWRSPRSPSWSGSMAVRASAARWHSISF